MAGRRSRRLTAAVITMTTCAAGGAVAVTAGNLGDMHLDGRTLATASRAGREIHTRTHTRPMGLAAPSRAGRVLRASYGAPGARAGLAPGTIPTMALSAYQRAAAVMHRADPSCRLSWTLLAAIGKVESDHGRYGGSRLTRNGVDRPAVLGPVLDGRGHVSAVPDTDAGALDGNRRWDRAVGPMQLLPGTWRVIAVDGDGDGIRNPQDINDSALAAAVYLCSGDLRLDETSDTSQAVYRYNHSRRYVGQVLRLAAEYADSTPAAAGPPTIGQPLIVPGLPHTLHRAHTLRGPATTGSGGPARHRVAGSRPHRTGPRHRQAQHAGAVRPDHKAMSRPAREGSTARPTTTPTTSASPSPSTPPDPTQDPTSAPTQPADPPTSPPTPQPTPLTGTWAICSGSDPTAPTYCVDTDSGELVLDLGTPEQQALTAVADFDGDGTIETNAEELAGLVGRTVGPDDAADPDAVDVEAVLQDDGTALVSTIDGQQLYPDPSGSTTPQ